MAQTNLNISSRKGRTYLYIEKGYRDENGKVKKKNVKTIGYLDELKLDANIEDPIAYFKEVARKMTEDEKASKNLILHIDMGDRLPEEAIGTRNLGYVLPLKIYHELGIDKFLKNQSQKEAFEYNANSIMILLAMCRIMSPCSKTQKCQKCQNHKLTYFARPVIIR